MLNVLVVSKVVNVGNSEKYVEYTSEPFCGLGLFRFVCTLNITWSFKYLNFVRFISEQAAAKMLKEGKSF